MTEALATNSKSKPRSGRKGAVGRLFVLELSGGRIHSMNPDGSDRKVIVTDCHLPDGIVGRCRRRPYLLDQHGRPVPASNDGSIERADLDGSNRRVIVPQGGTFTPKQLQLDKKNGKLYWCDREGMRVMRCKSRRLADRNAGRDGPRRCRPARPDQVVRRDHHRPRAQANLLDAKRPGQWQTAAASSAPASKSPRARPPPTAPTSKSSSTACRSRSISSSISKTASSTGPTAATLRAATRSIAPPSMQSRKRPRSC